MTIQGLINKIFKANQTPNNTVSWSGVNGLKAIQEDIVDTIRQRTFFTVPTTADLVNQGFNNAVLCYVQDHAFFRWEANGVLNGVTVFSANDGGVWVAESFGLNFYGSFQNNTTQLATTNNVGVATKFSTTNMSNQVIISNDTFGNPTLIKTLYPGVYNIQFSCQFQNTDTQLQDVHIWLRKNGQSTSYDVPNSGSLISVPNAHGGISGHTIAAWNFFVESNLNDYYQLVWSTTSVSKVSMQYYTPGSPPPGVPSVILTVNKVN